MKKNIILIFVALIIGFVISYLLSGIKSGIFLSFGWNGMYLLDRTGFPFLWQTKCPIPLEQFSIPTGCMDGFNATAFCLNILIFDCIVFLFIKVIEFAINYLSDKSL